MNEFKILIVDDDERMRHLIRDFLKKSGYITLEASNGEEALEIYFSDRKIDLFILDVMMPVLDGWDTLKEIRKEGNVPVIMLTARGEERDELKGFSIGADEYISKPFSPKVLVARVDALLRRTREARKEKTVVGGIEIDQDAHEVKVDGEIIELSVKEYELLMYFIENKGLALNREKILNNVWNYDYSGDERTIDTHVKKLRAKLQDKGSYIKTIWGMGYKFDPNEK